MEAASTEDVTMQPPRLQARGPALPRGRPSLTGVPQWETPTDMATVGDIRWPSRHKFGRPESLGHVRKFSHGGSVNSVAFLPGRGWPALGSENGMVLLLMVDADGHARRCQVLKGHGGSVRETGQSCSGRQTRRAGFSRSRSSRAIVV